MEIGIQFRCSLICDTENEHPDDVSKFVGLNATKIEVKGTPKINSQGREFPGKKAHENNCWIYDWPMKNNSEDFRESQYIVEIMQFIESHPKLIDVAKKYTRTFLRLSCYYSEERPYIYLGRELYSLFSKNNIPIEIDFYPFTVGASV